MASQLLALAYVLIVLVLAVYALHAGVLACLSLRARTPRPLGEPLPDPPKVTVQIPVYNERYVIERIIRAASALDYPTDRLQIQILDDSSDETSALARRTVERARSQGVRIEHVRRPSRAGFKAGALSHGLERAEGELVAIFDADFVPRPDFLRNLIQHRRLFDDPRVGFVQTRWTFRNREENLLTRAQGLLLDKHFFVEQPARSGEGLLFNFNGSGGIWRRSCLLDAGGWEEDTLTEDLDLSYRAQIRGWRGDFCSEETSPSDLPRSVVAFKRQQRRWARGSMQCLRKLLPRIVRAPLTPSQKIAAAMQLGGYLCQLFVFSFIILFPLVRLIGAEVPGWLGWSGAAALGAIASFYAAHHRRDGSRTPFLRELPAALGLAVGVSFSNSVAVVGGLLSRQRGEFDRTPKDSARHERGYRLHPDWTLWGELTVAAYGLGTCVLLLLSGDRWSALPMLSYSLAFAAVASSQAWEILGHQELAMRQPLAIDDP